MSTQEGGNDIQGLLGGQFLMQFQNLQLTGQIEAVAAFSFNGGGATGSELLQSRKGALTSRREVCSQNSGCRRHA